MTVIEITDQPMTLYDLIIRNKIEIKNSYNNKTI